MLRIPFEVVDVSEPITLDEILERTWYGIISTPMDGKLMLLLDTAPNHILYNHPHMVSTLKSGSSSPCKVWRKQHPTPRPCCSRTTTTSSRGCAEVRRAPPFVGLIAMLRSGSK